MKDPNDGFDARPNEGVLPMFTVFAPPAEHPTLFILRRFDVKAGEARRTELYREGRTLDEVRAQVPYGLVCITRDPNDDPSVVESWF